MSGVDIAILVILGAFVLKGMLRGLLRELCSLLGLTVGGFLAFTFHGPLAQSLAEAFNLPARLCVIAAFLLLFLTTVLLFSLLGYLLSRFVKMIFLGGINRMAGCFFGLIQGVLLLTVVLTAVSLGPFPETVRPYLEESELAPPFVRLGSTMFSGAAGLR